MAGVVQAAVRESGWAGGPEAFHCGSCTVSRRMAPFVTRREVAAAATLFPMRRCCRLFVR